MHACDESYNIAKAMYGLQAIQSKVGMSSRRILVQGTIPAELLYILPVGVLLIKTGCCVLPGDFSQGLLPATGAPGIVVPMVSLLPGFMHELSGHLDRLSALHVRQ